MLAAYPIHEPGNLRMSAKSSRGCKAPFQFPVAEKGMDRPVADRMNRHRVAAAAALRDRVMPFDTTTQRTTAEKAGRPVLPSHFLSQWRRANQANTIAPTTTQKVTTPQKAHGRCA